MNPLRQLKTIVATASSVETGTVTAVAAASVSVRARSGLKSFAAPNASLFRPGDTVRFQGNTLLGKATPADTLPIFRV